MNKRWPSDRSLPRSSAEVFNNSAILSSPLLSVLLYVYIYLSSSSSSSPFRLFSSFLRSFLPSVFLLPLRETRLVPLICLDSSRKLDCYTRLHPLLTHTQNICRGSALRRHGHHHRQFRRHQRSQHGESAESIIIPFLFLQFFFFFFFFCMPFVDFRRRRLMRMRSSRISSSRLADGSTL